MSHMKLKIVTPERLVYEAVVDSVTVPTTSRTIAYNLFPAEFADEPDFAERERVYYDYLDLVRSEDRGMVASLQNAMASSLFVPGRMNFLEKGIHHVLNAYLDRMFGESGSPR